MTKHAGIYAMVALIACLASTAIAGEKEPGLNETKLSGDWNGIRTSLAESGVDFEIINRFDVFATVSGGKDQRATAFNNFDIAATFDGEQLVGLKGLSAYLQFYSTLGGHPDIKITGSAQWWNNYEVPENTNQLYQAYIQQNLFDDKLSLLAGMYDFNWEFYVTEPSWLFIHSAYGIGSELSFSGGNGPSTYPYTGLGTRIKIQPTDEIYLMAAALDGFPGARNHESGTHIGIHDEDGLMYIAEAGFIPGGKEPRGKFGVGGWFYTEKMVDLVTSNPTRSKGFYVLSEYKLTEKLIGIARAGIANEEVNQFDYSWVVGVIYNGLIPGRDEGQLGFGINQVHMSDKYRQANAPLDSRETAFELTYADKLAPWFTVQPDLQYIINPGANPAYDDAWIVGTRFIVDF